MSFVLSADRHHFDNPVYSYQTPASKGDDGTNLLLNNVQKIRNNLGASKNTTNLERQKLGAGCSEDDDDISTKGMTCCVPCLWFHMFGGIIPVV
jgi:hypothetical protein